MKMYVILFCLIKRILIIYGKELVNMNKWQLFSILKGFKEIDQEEINMISKMNENDIKDGVTEYIIWKNKNHVTDDREGVL